MNNDADQKPKWREWWIAQRGGLSWVFDENIPPLPFKVTHVIEAAPVLNHISELEIQLDILAKALEQYSAGKLTPIATEALEQYEKWKARK